MPTGALPVLYSFRRCPYAIRARLALHASGTPCALREVVLRDKPLALLAASPQATVPVLVLRDGEVIAQSLDIMRWALARHDPQGWLRPGVGTLDDALALIADCDLHFKRDLDRYKYPGRYEDADADVHRSQGAAFLMRLQAQLQATPHLAGARSGLADHAIAPFVRQFAMVEPDWFVQQPWPHLRAWLDGWTGSEAFAAVMHRYAPWRASDTVPVVFPPGH
ncbi:glutathione S-transferase [Variovorax ginsengisoli]|nr:glutathione S-transferase [Variovorax ginsengisoli]